MHPSHQQTFQGILGAHRKEELISNPQFRGKETKTFRSPTSLPGEQSTSSPNTLLTKGCQSQFTRDQIAVALPQEKGAEGPCRHRDLGLIHSPLEDWDLISCNLLGVFLTIQIESESPPASKVGLVGSWIQRFPWCSRRGHSWSSAQLVLTCWESTWSTTRSKNKGLQGMGWNLDRMYKVIREGLYL